LKADNILLDKDFNIKIIDFGMSCSVLGRTGEGYNTTRVGTQGFQAPEILIKNPIYKTHIYNGAVVDIFALGVVLVILATGIPPFSHAHIRDARYLKLQHDPEAYWGDYHDWIEDLELSSEFKKLVETMLKLNPMDRMSIEEILEDPWFKLPIASQK
jgi:serine/threonine protein kinase